jgi:hypothetical protein
MLKELIIKILNVKENKQKMILNSCSIKQKLEKKFKENSIAFKQMPE